jgi:hypothetical protein
MPEDVRLDLLQSPSKSLRKLSHQKNMSLGTAHKATQVPQLQAYRVHIMRELHPTDHSARLHHCGWLKMFICNNNQVLDNTFFPDEAWFHLSNYVNRQF